MRVILIKKRGGRNKLYLGEVNTPEPKSGQVLIKVYATSVNQADLLQRRGLYPPPPGASPILGLDVAGEVVEKGPDVSRWSPGNRVFAFVPGGGYGEYIVTSEHHLWEIPSNFEFESAAAVGEVFATAFLNLFIIGKLQQGERVLIHGGNGGVGTACIQLARKAGAKILTTVRTQKGRALCKELGAKHIINYKEEDFETCVHQVTNGEGVDLIIDFVGATYLNKHLNILRQKGRLILIGLKGGTKTDIFLPPVITNRLEIRGSLLRSQNDTEKAALFKSFEKEVLPLLASGEVYPVIDTVYPISQVEEAHQRFRQNKHVGKIVLTWLGV